MIMSICPNHLDPYSEDLFSGLDFDLDFSLWGGDKDKDSNAVREEPWISKYLLFFWMFIEWSSLFIPLCVFSVISFSVIFFLVNY